MLIVISLIFINFHINDICEVLLIKIYNEDFIIYLLNPYVLIYLKLSLMNVIIWDDE